jgi:two-component system, response regulator YesN
MHKVMLVDDQLLDLEGMEKLIDWNRMSMQVVASFHSPLRAYDYFHRHPVDILITDIGMPQMSGLELAEKCKQMYKPLKVLFVSGFQEFAYAQKAVDLQANGYILKPYDDNDILRSLETIRQELEEDNNTIHWKERVEAARAIVKNELVMRWLEGRVDGRQIVALLTDYGLVSDSIYSVALLELDGFGRGKSLDKQERHDSVPFQLLMEHCERIGLADYCMVSAERLAVILHGPDEVPWRGLLEELVLYARRKLPMTVTIGWGKSVYDPKNLYLSYEDAKMVLNAKLFHGKDRILTIRNTSWHESVHPTLEVHISVQELFTSVLRGEADRIDELLDNLFTQWRRLETRQDLYQKILKFISEIERQLDALGEHLSAVVDWDVTNTELLAPFETITEIKEWLEDGLLRISRHLSAKMHNRNHILIEQIKTYIEEDRLQTNVTLHDTAERFGFSPNHLGVLFKEVTGCNFRDFVIHTRIEKAKGMLRDPSIKIYEIAFLIGYQNENYFYRQFKQIVGVTPNEFRTKSLR